MDRGFNAMVPQAKEEHKEESIYDYGIKFNLLGKRFQFTLKVDNTRRST